MKSIDRMGGNPHWLSQGAGEPLGLSEPGRSVLVSSRPLKGTGEARGNAANRPGLAKEIARRVQTTWISTYGEVVPCLKTLPDGTASVGVNFVAVSLTLRCSLMLVNCKWMTWTNLTYSTYHSGAGICGDRLADNHRLHDFVESINRNMGELTGDVKESER